MRASPLLASSDGRLLLNPKQAEVEVCGKRILFETGKMGKQADGSAVLRMGDTIVYSTVCYQKDVSEVDFAPLRVDYFARFR